MPPRSPSASAAGEPWSRYRAREGSVFVSIYRLFGLTPLVNAAGTKTRLGGVPMDPEVRQAMDEAAGSSVDMAQLQAAASRVIAEATGAEAGYVTSGAAAGLTLGAAACMTGEDPALIDRLPFTDGMPNQIVIARTHRNSYDHAWRAAGARLVEAGVDDRAVGSGMRAIEPWEIEAAIGPDTVAVAYVANRRDDPPLREIVEVAHRHRLPVLVDAAAQLPPASNLRAFIDIGADLVAFSGGKAVRGPQATGILCGRRDLIRAVLLNHLDMDQLAGHWEPPSELFPDGLSAGLPRHGVGRGFKVGKENVIGLLVALQRFVAGPAPDDEARRRRIVHDVNAALSGDERVEVHENPAFGIPRLELRFAAADAAAAVLRGLEAGEPAIAVDPGRVAEGVLVVDTIGLDDDEGRIVAERLATLVSRLPEPKRAADGASEPTS
ncbi:MAG: aminotransferase class V-fold PLP-dependent enzyme [Trueperaceae bacterium]